MPDGPSAGFGRLAWVYEGLEHTVYGDLLERSRLALLDDLAPSRRILTLGEDDGRFLLALLQTYRTCKVTVLEHSPGMVKRARARIEKCLSEAQTRVSFRQENVLSAEFAAESYDAVVTHFFLDVFGDAQLPQLVKKLDACLEPGGLWLISDFAQPHAVKEGWDRLGSHLLLPLMYGFFKLTTQLPATKLTSPRPYLQAVGLRPLRLERSRSGFVYAELWQKPERYRVPKNPARTERA